MSREPKEKDRPMQGQSPYLINAGFFYQHADSGWNAALLYNRIGKRIIGVGLVWEPQTMKSEYPILMKCPVMQ